MPLKYYIQELPRMRDEKQQAFPKLKTYNAFNNEKMINRIALESGLQEGAVLAVLDALPKALKNILLEGHTCKLDGIGTFSLSLTFDENHEVTINKLNLKIDTDFIKELREEAMFEKVQQEVVAVGSSKGCIDNHVELVHTWLKTHPFITLQEYANLTKVSPSTASRELKKICDNPSYGIRLKGTGTRKIWVNSGFKQDKQR